MKSQLTDEYDIPLWSSNTQTTDGQKQREKWKNV